ncbi:MAG: 23S rRNA (pseudouridine(1915)-N(3))-methyltransferase RlmH [Thermaceae bacterium]
MRPLVLAVGRPHLCAREVERYAERLRPWGGSLEFVRKKGDLFARSEGRRRVVLDERGRLMTTLELARFLKGWEGERVAFLVADAEGFDEEERGRADLLLSLSPLTLQHELALLVLMEQLYRVYTLWTGHPYHR